MSPCGLSVFFPRCFTALLTSEWGADSRAASERRGGGPPSKRYLHFTVIVWTLLKFHSLSPGDGGKLAANWHGSQAEFILRDARRNVDRTSHLLVRSAAFKSSDTLLRWIPCGKGVKSNVKWWMRQKAVVHIFTYQTHQQVSILSKQLSKHCRNFIYCL